MTCCTLHMISPQCVHIRTLAGCLYSFWHATNIPTFLIRIKYGGPYPPNYMLLYWSTYWPNYMVLYWGTYHPNYMVLCWGPYRPNYMAIHLTRTYLFKTRSSVNNLCPIWSSSVHYYSCSVWQKTMVSAASTTETHKLTNLVYSLRPLVKSECLTPRVFSLCNNSEDVSFRTRYTAIA